MWRQHDFKHTWSRQPRPLVERFWEKVDVRGPDDCWPWMAALNGQGYGNLGSGDGKTLRANRVSYELAYGPIEPGHMVCHRCDNPACVNPTHLYAASQANNLRDMAEKGRSTRGERSASAKLNDAAVAIIRSATIKQNMLAKNFGVSPMAISLAKRGLTWRHV